MANRRGALLPGLLERELLGSTRGGFVPHAFTNAFTCAGSHAGVIRVDPDGDPCPPYSITYNKVAHGCRLLAVGDEEGCVSVLDTRAEALPRSLYTDAERPPRAKWLAHNNTIFDIAWAKSDSVLYTASGDQHVGVWDTTAGQLRVYCAGHDGSVKVVAPHASQPDVFASGSRDGGILLWDLRCPATWSAAKRRMQLAPRLRINIATAPGAGTGGSTPGSGGKRRAGAPAAGSTRRSVTSLLFVPHDEHTLISSSDMDGTVRLWDLRRLTAPTGSVSLPQQQPAAGSGAKSRGSGRSKPGGQAAAAAEACWLGFACPSRASSRPAGITSMALSPAGDTLLVSSIDSCHYLYSLARLDGPPLAAFAGHRSSSFCVKSCFSPCGRHVLSGSSDKRGYVWQVADPSAPPVVLSGHAGEVTAVAWCPGDFCQLATAADDATLRVWVLDRANPRYERDYAQHNYAFSDARADALWARFGLSSSQQPQQQGQGQQQQQAWPGTTPRPRSICSPTTPQLPFWRAAAAAAAAAGTAGIAGDAAAGAAATAGPSPGAGLPLDSSCITPTRPRCQGAPGIVSPLAHATPRMRQMRLPEQLSAARRARHADPAGQTACGHAPVQQLEQQQHEQQGQHGHQQRQHEQQQEQPQHGQQEQQALDAVQRRHSHDQQQPDEAQQVVMVPCSLPATGDGASGGQGSAKAFEHWMDGLTPSPPSSPDDGQPNDQQQPQQQQQQHDPNAAPATGPLPAAFGTAATAQRSSLRRGGLVEACTPWNLPSPLRQQRQVEQASLEAQRLQQRPCNLLPRQLLHDAPLASSGGRDELASPAGGRDCCRLLHDEFEVWCDEEDKPAAGAAAAAGAAGGRRPQLAVPAGCSVGGDSNLMSPAGGASHQENAWQLLARASAAAGGGSHGPVAGHAPAAAAAAAADGLVSMAGSPPAGEVDMVPCSLPADQQTQQQQTQQQQGCAAAPGLFGQQPYGGLKPAEVLGASRTPLGDLSPMMQGLELTAPAQEHEPQGQAPAALSPASRARLAGGAEHRHSPVRVLDLHAGGPAAAGSPLLQMLHHGRPPGSQQGAACMLSQPRGLQQQCPSPPRHHSPGDLCLRKRSRLGCDSPCQQQPQLGMTHVQQPQAAGPQHAQEAGQALQSEPGEAQAAPEAASPPAAAAAAGAAGGIRRSAVAHASGRKRQCRLADLWSKPPEVEDAASRFSG